MAYIFKNWHAVKLKQIVPSRSDSFDQHHMRAPKMSHVPLQPPVDRKSIRNNKTEVKST
jgi:hypothetical protein